MLIRVEDFFENFGELWRIQMPKDENGDLVRLKYAKITFNCFDSDEIPFQRSLQKILAGISSESVIIQTFTELVIPNGNQTMEQKISDLLPDDCSLKSVQEVEQQEDYCHVCNEDMNCFECGGYMSVKFKSESTEYEMRAYKIITESEVHQFEGLGPEMMRQLIARNNPDMTEEQLDEEVQADMLRMWVNHEERLARRNGEVERHFGND